MKRWAILTVLLYGVVLALLTVPVVFVLFLGKSEQGAVTPLMSLADVLSWYQEWGYWVWLAVMLAGQALLLLVPVGLAERRLPARRGLWAPILTASFLLANVFFGAILSIECAAFGDGAGSAWEWLGAATSRSIGCAIASTIVLLWIIWGAVYYRYARADDPQALTKRATRWLLRGSILELLVAVPSHIVVRHRNDCCAPICRTLPKAAPPNGTTSAGEHRARQIPVKPYACFKTKREPTGDPGIDRPSSLTPSSTSGTVQI